MGKCAFTNEKKKENCLPNTSYSSFGRQNSIDHEVQASICRLTYCFTLISNPLPDVSYLITVPIVGFVQYKNRAVHTMIKWVKHSNERQFPAVWETTQIFYGMMQRVFYSTAVFYSTPYHHPAAVLRRSGRCCHCRSAAQRQGALAGDIWSGSSSFCSVGRPSGYLLYCAEHCEQGHCSCSRCRCEPHYAAVL